MFAPNAWHIGDLQSWQPVAASDYRTELSDMNDSREWKTKDKPVSAKRYDIVVFGDTCVDLILRDDDIVPRFGQVEKIVAGYHLEMGGSCCIFAAQAAKLGLSVALLGRVGDDAFGELIMNTLKAAGVDTQFVSVDASLSTGITVHLVQNDDRAMLTHLGSLNALTRLDVTRDILASARHLHYGSLYLQTGLLPNWVDILQDAKHSGLSVSLDTNWDPHERWNHGFKRALDFIDLLLPNEQEALKLSGATDFSAAVESLRERVPILVVKQAEKGATAWYRDCEISHVVDPAESGGDGIGAGDSFDAGFLASWLQGLPLETCLSIACQCGRAVAGMAGGLRGQPWRSEIAAL